MFMKAIASNISGLFSLLGEELYNDYTSRANRAESLGGTSCGDAHA